MRAASEVKNFIRKSWYDRRVANWAIEQLPLLEFENQFPPAPIFKLSKRKGLRILNPSNRLKKYTFADSLKIGGSGGWEGTQRHLEAAERIHEVFQILAPKDQLYMHPTVLMLEPDSYIQ